MENKSKHSKEFIDEMKGRLLQEKAMLEGELGIISDENKGDYQAKYPEYGRHEEENADEVADYQARAAATEAAESRLENVIAALKRIEEGTYGETDEGELIPEGRLRANPAATTILSKPKK